MVLFILCVFTCVKSHTTSMHLHVCGTPPTHNYNYHERERERERERICEIVER